MSVWNWLPAFRVVAEFESVHRAASALAVSASALSRTIRLAEDALGHALFVRDPSGLRLTDAGARVLGATRDAMRLIDDGISSLAPDATTSLAVGFTTALGERVLLRALGEMPRDDTRALDIRRVEEPNVGPELLRGLLDLVVCSAPPSADDLDRTRLGDVPYEIFAPPGVDSTDGDRVTLAGGGSRIRGASLEGVEHLARSRKILAEIPRGLAPADFRRVEAPSPRTETLYVVTRKRLGEDAPATGMVALLRGALQFD